MYNNFFAIYLNFITVSLFLIFYTLPASSQAFQWAKNEGSTEFDSGRSICIDNSGNIYITGVFSDTGDFDPGPGVYNLNSNGGSDIFIQKLDNAGNLIWVKSIGGIQGDIGSCIKVDNKGNLYVSGTYSNTVDFDPGPGIQNLIGNGVNLFVLKLDTAGNYIWAKSMGGSNIEENWGLAVDSNKNVYTTGQFQGLVDFDPGMNIYNLISNGGKDIYISKLDSMGQFQWAHSFGDNFTDRGSAVSIDGSNNVLLTGSFAGTVDFDPGPGVFNLTASSSDIFILKLDANGNLLWVKDSESSGADFANDIACDNNSNLYVTGYFSDSVDFDPGPGVYYLYSDPNNNTVNAFTIKLTSNGNLTWAKAFVGGASEGKSIAVDNIGDVYTLGTFNDSTDFDPGNGTYKLAPNGGKDILLSKLDANGNFLWGKNFGGVGNFGNDVGYSLVVDNAGAVYATGNFSDTADFDPSPAVFNLVSNGNTYSDVFVFKYHYCGSNNNVTINACDSVTLFGTTYYTSAVLVQQFLNVQDCDSNVITNIIVNANTYGTLTDSSCGGYEYYGQTYNVSGIYTQAIPNAAGCDSIMTLTLTVHPINIGVTQNGLTFTAIATGAVSYQWIKCNPYQIIPGAINQTFTATSNGDYAVIITDVECSDTSACFPVHGVGINYHAESADFFLYPNPVSQRLVIESKTGFNTGGIKIITVAGQVVLNRYNINADKIEIDMTNLVSGLYFVEIEDESRKIIRLVTKE